MNWGDSCVSGDTDYSIFEGRIDPPFVELRGADLFHRRGDRYQRLAGAPVSRYYLVVPNNGTFEGGYGISSQGCAARPGHRPACFAQNLAPCD